jgi:hypothetical protein
MNMLTDTGKVLAGIAALHLVVLVGAGSVGGCLYLMDRVEPDVVEPLTQAEIDFLNSLRDTVNMDHMEDIDRSAVDIGE